MKGVEWEQLFFIILLVVLVLLAATWMLMGGKVDFLSYAK